MIKTTERLDVRSRLTTVARYGALTFAAAAALISCGGGSDSEALGMDHVEGQPANLPWSDQQSAGDPNHLTIALKYVAYADATGSVVNTEQAKAAISGVNAIYAPCNLHFRVEEFVQAQPDQHGLRFNPAGMNELSEIRAAFEDASRLSVIATGDWGGAGLGGDGANAWTTMPGTFPAGAVLERSVGGNAGLIAHEVGHYLNLNHVSNSANLMNPVIYPSSRTLSSAQCESVRQAALSVWSATLR